MCDRLVLPFEKRIDYSKMIVRVRERDIEALPWLMSNISQEHITSMQQHIVRERPKLSYFSGDVIANEIIIRVVGGSAQTANKTAARLPRGPPRDLGGILAVRAK